MNKKISRKTISRGLLLLKTKKRYLFIIILLISLPFFLKTDIYPKEATSSLLSSITPFGINIKKAQGNKETILIIENTDREIKKPEKNKHSPQRIEVIPSEEKEEIILEEIILREATECSPEQININIASKEDLTKITGIGPTRADSIIENREFFSLDDLSLVPGIGEVTIKKIKEQGLACTKGEPLVISIEKDLYVEEIIEKININTASKEELTKITGVGEVTAENIINYRRIFPFEKIDDLINVSGIGTATLKKIKEQGLAYVEEVDNKITEETSLQLPEKININTAPMEELVFITGVGETRARNIIDYRAINLFCSVDSLTIIPGIGEATLRKIKEQGLAYVEERCSSFPSVQYSNKKIEINVANKEELIKITGVGEVTAENIINYRKQSPFCSLDDLMKVAGIGEATLRKIKEQGLAYVEESCSSSLSLTTSNNEKIDINTASKEELTKITGVGEVTAENIINYRSENTFYSINDLINISGIGEVTLNKIKEQGLAYVEENNNEITEETPLQLPEKININTASKEELTKITGIGESRAESIINYREEQPFESLDDLINISGIGEATLEKIKEQGLACVES